ncbi:DUF6445 family protein [Paraglaciecola aquimarina]|uniref:DUF6445 family protein n=1 Tax=Paraglaciecola aquimarina TaxID=1235557 RepID=A0ABU3SY52_9ALTE|nr:DUF6445 family protein [Paraglaciecola aquimarina]MDU0354944.1 DUF6445 family protein [Paraglaciecola aquimarina]
MMYTVNPLAKHSYSVVGNEQTPVYIIDNFMTDVDECKQYALTQATFAKPEKSAYPGKIAKLPKEYTEVVLQQAIEVIHTFYQVPTNLRLVKEAMVYSIVTQSEDSLELKQAIPHFDSLSSKHFAIMHYINEGKFDGTGFYRHNPTGFEKIDQQKLPILDKAVVDYFNQKGLPRQAYFNLSDDHFSLIGKVDYQPNRLVIYPGALLHSALIDPNRDVIDNINTGRLTSNIFIDFE